MRNQHTHQCQGARCLTQIACDGPLESNPDGFPAVICPEFHRPGGRINPDFLCESCQLAAEQNAPAQEDHA